MKINDRHRFTLDNNNTLLWDKSLLGIRFCGGGFTLSRVLAAFNFAKQIASNTVRILSTATEVCSVFNGRLGPLRERDKCV